MAVFRGNAAARGLQLAFVSSHRPAGRTTQLRVETSGRDSTQVSGRLRVGMHCATAARRHSIVFSAATRAKLRWAGVLSASRALPASRVPSASRVPLAVAGETANVLRDGKRTEPNLDRIAHAPKGHHHDGCRRTAAPDQ